MAVTDIRSRCGAARSGARPTLRSLYEAARREVMADPAAAVRKYEPTWSIASTAAYAKPRVHLRIVR
jgi:phage baseplate assembly protein W